MLNSNEIEEHRISYIIGFAKLQGVLISATNTLKDKSSLINSNDVIGLLTSIFRDSRFNYFQESSLIALSL
jgi:hypothetical protein